MERHEDAVFTLPTLNLRALEGVVEKDDLRRYRLTDLGLRALGLLRGLTEDLDAMVGGDGRSYGLGYKAHIAADVDSNLP